MAKNVSCRIDDSEYEVLVAYARQYDATISWAVRRALKEFTTKLTKENKNGTKDYFFAESDVGACEDGLSTGGDTTES